MAFPYIYGTRHGVSVIDMRETLTALRRAAALVRTTVENDGIVLFVGGKSIKGSERVLDANARKMGRNGYATSKWLPGTLTNASTLFGSSRNMITDTDVNPTSYKPSLIVLFAPLQTPFALREANATNVPTIALCDSNVDPRHFTYPIPSNDDSLRVVELISGVLAEAGKEGIKKREHKEKQVQSTTNLIEQEYEAQQRSLYKSKQRRLR
jgi:small subunit ribosomal protein S2